MDYQQKSVPVEVYRLTEDVERLAPEWLGDAILAGAVFIDHSLVDGAARVYGCTIRGPTGQQNIKVGDYIVQEPTGNLRGVKCQDFRQLYQKLQI